MPRTYKHGRSLIKAIARERGVPVSRVKYELMKSATEAAKEIIGPGGDYLTKWLPTLKEVLPIAYDLLAKYHRVPSPFEIVEAYRKKVAVATATA